MKTPQEHSLGNPLDFLTHIKCRTNDDRFSSSQWESFLFSILRRVKLNQRILRFMTAWLQDGTILSSVGHRVKTHKERGDLEVKDCVVLQKPQAQDNRLPPPHTLISDFTMTHVRFGCSHLHPMGQLENTRRSDGVPDPDGDLKSVVRIKLRYYRNLYLNRPDPIAFIPLVVDTTG